jgi:hypothetical protein
MQVVIPRAKRGLFFPFDTQPRIVLSASSMSNAESDRKPDGSAEDDDEPDEWWVWWRFLWRT